MSLMSLEDGLILFGILEIRPFYNRRSTNLRGHCPDKKQMSIIQIVARHISTPILPVVVSPMTPRHQQFYLCDVQGHNTQHTLANRIVHGGVIARLVRTSKEDT